MDASARAESEGHYYDDDQRQTGAPRDTQNIRARNPHLIERRALSARIHTITYFDPAVAGQSRRPHERGRFLHNKKTPFRDALMLVDPSDIFWNTFFECVVKWRAELKIVYRDL